MYCRMLAPSRLRALIPLIAVWAAGLVALIPDSLRGAPVEYVDIAALAGISGSVTYGSPSESNYILETTGTGAAIFDFDRDGDNDVLIVNGTTFPLDRAGRSPASMLYVNDGTASFTEAAAEKGLTAKGWGQAACVGDIDNDGWDDLLVTYFGSNVLYRNSKGKFTDASAGLGQVNGSRRWGAGCAFLDFDADGLLDIFISSYVDFDPENTPKPGSGGACE